MKLMPTRLLAATLAALLLAACGSPAGVSALQSASTATAPLVGTWRFRGSVPSHIDAALTFGADGRYTLSENVAPATTPSGSHDSSGCTTTLITSGTYFADNGKLTFEFDGGFANALSGCDDPSRDSAGTPLTPDAIAAYTEQGILPASNQAYSVDSDELTLTPGFGHLDTGTTLSIER